MKKSLTLGASMAAMVCTVAGMFFGINGQYQESSMAWNATAMILWGIFLFSEKAQT